MEDRLKKLTKYIKSKYPNRTTLKIGQVADELLMDKTQIRTLRDSGRLSTFSVRSIASFVLSNPPKKVETL